MSNTKKQKILYINTFTNSGGSTLACLEIAKELKKQNSQFELIFVISTNGPLKKEFKKLGQVLLIAWPLTFNYDPLAIKDIIDKYKPDIVHAFIPGHESPEYFSILPKNIKKVITVLCGQPIGFDHNLFDHVLFLSEYNKNLSPQVTENGQVIRCGLSDIVEKQAGKIPLKKRSAIFGRISAFCPSKKIKDTIECMGKFPDNLCCLAGEILDINYFMDIINNLPINISFVNDLKEHNKDTFYNGIDVLHYPSSNEAFCFSILEGMRAGLPIISYNESAIPELNHNDNICLAQPNNIEELETITKNLINNPELIEELGRKNREVYEEYYTAEKYAENILSKVYL